jgi:alanine-glyoxylate transaminase/serine-glyoxylate transaminase/serine-pyruvate transaminase
MIKDEGLENVWNRHTALAETIWAAFAAWETKGKMRLNISDPSKRGTSVTAVCTGSGDGLALQNWTEQQAGLTLGIGLGREKAADFYRIGHMGHVNAHMIMGMLDGAV